MSLPNFFYNPRMMQYNFGPQHPLKPERLALTMKLLGELDAYAPIDPGTGDVEDVRRVHDAEYIDKVRELSIERPKSEDEAAEAYAFGFGAGDNPPFGGMYEAALAYVAGSAAAARKVNDGAPLAYGIAGGLHHARRRQASGFCIFNDCSIACHILREKFDKVAYVDIDVHHGEGVQWIFEDDPTVLTCSIHESGRTLYPGSGFRQETSKEKAIVNVPVDAGTTGPEWIAAFEHDIMPPLKEFNPGAIVLQMGTDTHYLDPLAHINSNANDWLKAVRMVRDLHIPIVALGGGGYNLTTVPRMWAAACLSLDMREVPERLLD